MSTEPTCDFCGASDKFRCRSAMEASGCESYREQNRIQAIITQGTVTGRFSHEKANFGNSITVQGPRGPMTVCEDGDQILVKREGATLIFEPEEVPEMMGALQTILKEKVRQWNPK